MASSFLFTSRNHWQFLSRQNACPIYLSSPLSVWKPLLLPRQFARKTDFCSSNMYRVVTRNWTGETTRRPQLLANAFCTYFYALCISIVEYWFSHTKWNSKSLRAWHQGKVCGKKESESAIVLKSDMQFLQESLDLFVWNCCHCIIPVSQNLAHPWHPG